MTSMKVTKIEYVIIDGERNVELTKHSNKEDAALSLAAMTAQYNVNLKLVRKIIIEETL